LFTFAAMATNGHRSEAYVKVKTSTGVRVRHELNFKKTKLDGSYAQDN
jgi:hypothetical protein